MSESRRASHLVFRARRPHGATLPHRGATSVTWTTSAPATVRIAHDCLCFMEGTSAVRSASVTTTTADTGRGSAS